MPKDKCEILLATRELKADLPPINILSAAPLVVPSGGKLTLVEGYDEDTGILVRGWKGGELPEIELPEAVEMIRDLLADFDFPSESDRSRAVAALLTPSAILGGLLKGQARAPVYVIEADASQTGKGTLIKIVSRVTGEPMETITQKKGGVGSIDEAFSSAVHAGRNLVLFDNLRGAVDSPFLESLTTEDRQSIRVPYSAPVQMDVRKVSIYLTSNRAELTRDLANRSVAVRLRKQPAGFVFKKYPEGGLLDHIEANQARYLSAIHSVFRHWWDSGKPETNETRHSLRPGVQPMDWIVQNVFGLPPLLDGHTEAQDRVCDPSLQWLRDLSLAVQSEGMLDRALQAYDLLDLNIEHKLGWPVGMEIGGTEETRTQDLQAIGRKLGKWFKSSDSIEVDQFKVDRTENDSSGHHGTLKKYVFSHISAIAAGKAETFQKKDAVYTPDTLYPKIPENVGIPSGYSGYSGNKGNNDLNLNHREQELYEMF
jgi:hypothetical protein